MPPSIPVPIRNSPAGSQGVPQARWSRDLFSPPPRPPPARSSLPSSQPALVTQGFNLVTRGMHEEPGNSPGVSRPHGPSAHKTPPGHTASASLALLAGEEEEHPRAGSPGEYLSRVYVLPFSLPWARGTPPCRLLPSKRFLIEELIPRQNPVAEPLKRKRRLLRPGPRFAAR